MVRNLLLLPLVLVVAFLWAGVVALWASLSPRSFRRRGHGLVRGWGRAIMFLLGVRLHATGLERLKEGPAVLLFNHISVFDMAVLAAVWQEAVVVVYKKEFHRIPIIGRTLRAMNMIAIDRQNHGSAINSLEGAAERINAQKSIVMLAPEGTRSRHGRLQSFKKGPFRLALATKAPIIPMLLKGIAELAPSGTWLMRPGKVTVEVLEPIPTDAWTLESLSEEIDSVRELFLRELGCGEA